MYPIALNLASASILLVGKGPAFARRKAQLEEAGVRRLTAIEANAVNAGEFAHHAVIMVAGLEREAAEIIAHEARKQKKLVNVEDVNDLCDFYFTAHVNRGDLSIAVSTNGASPTLAKEVRNKVADIFGEEWVDRTQAIKNFRDELRAQGKSIQEVAELCESYIEKQNWFVVPKREDVA
jgi:precorrin-2 dehydrogenase/sirohydrochlorin ferrochelatase